MEQRFAVALLLLLTVSITAYHILDKHLLDLHSYEQILNVRRFIEGKEPAGMTNQLTAAVYSFFSTGEFNPSILLTIAKILPIVLSALSVVAFYFMLKEMFSPLASFAGAVLLLSSQAFLLGMRSGVYSPDSLGMCLFIFACLSLFRSKKNYLLLALSAVLFILSSLGWSAGWVMVAIVAISLLLQQLFYPSKKEHSYEAMVALLASLISYFLTTPTIFTKTSSASPFLPTLPLLVFGFLLFLARLAGKYQCKGKLEFFTASFFILSALLYNFDAFPSSLGIALFSAFSVNELIAIKEQKAILALFSLTILFVSFEFTQTFLKFEQSLVASLLIAASSVFIVSLYRDRRIDVYLTFSIILLVLLSSLNTAALTQIRISDTIGSPVDEMMEWAGELPENSTFWVFRITPLMEFMTGRNCYENDTEFAQFILSNNSVSFLKERNITHLMIDASMFDNIEMMKTYANNTKVRIDSFRLYGIQVDQTGNRYAVFVTTDGKVAFAQIDPLTNNLMEGDVVIYMGEGRRTVPLKKFLRIGNYRLVYPQDNYRVNLFLLFFENVDGLREVYNSENQDIKVFEVVG
ncbi:MAG: hypothetical protein QXF56_03070 [Candidatus Micrarchaeia archaeon]